MVTQREPAADDETMPVLVYRFDDPAAFPVLETQTTDLHAWRIAGAVENGKPAMSVSWERGSRSTAGAALCLALPRIAIEGDPTRLSLALRGDGSGCGIWLDATDAHGPGFRYAIGPVHFHGVQTCWVDVDHPADYWQRTPPDQAGIRPPLQLHRLVVEVLPPSSRVHVVLLHLVVAGDVRLASPGLA